MSCRGPAGSTVSFLPSQAIRRYTLRTDGFVSVRAGHAGGGFATGPLAFSGSGSGGGDLGAVSGQPVRLRVELRDADL